MKKTRESFTEKEKLLNEKHKIEINEIITKHQIEFDSMKMNLKNEINFRTQDSDDKIKSLNRK